MFARPSVKIVTLEPGLPSPAIAIDVITDGPRAVAPPRFILYNSSINLELVIETG